MRFRVTKDIEALCIRVSIGKEKEIIIGGVAKKSDCNNANGVMSD